MTGRNQLDHDDKLGTLQHCKILKMEVSTLLKLIWEHKDDNKSAQPKDHNI